MTALLTIGALFIGILIGLAAPHARTRNRRSPQLASTRQILLPFTATTLSRRALEAAIRLAKVDGATLMPAFLATVPLSLSLESPLPKQSRIGMPLLEAIEQHASAQGVPIASRDRSAGRRSKRPPRRRGRCRRDAVTRPGARSWLLLPHRATHSTRPDC